MEEVTIVIVENPDAVTISVSEVAEQVSINVSEVGTPGLDGLSAYEIWLQEGNTGTEQDFLDSLEATGITWINYVSEWTAPPVLNATIPSGSVYAYSNAQLGQIFRLVPNPYDPAVDAFYSTFDGTNLSDLITTRST